MFGDLNKVELIGNITQDLELRYIASGTAVMNFSMATNRRTKKGEEWVDEANFHNLVLWGKQAETMKRFAKKGTRLFVSGRLQTRSWDGDDGKKNYKTEIVVEEVSLLARYDKEGTGKVEASAPSKATSKGEASDEVINPEDLPF